MKLADLGFLGMMVSPEYGGAGLDTVSYVLAMKEISITFPDAVYVVLGQTHPNLLEHEGEKYRNYLQQLITDNGLEENVRLINGRIRLPGDRSMMRRRSSRVRHSMHSASVRW